MRHFLKPAVLALAVGAALSATAARAEMMMYKATMNGASESPATSSPGTGSVDATYDSATKKLSWKGTYSGLTGPATAAHFHGPAEPGKNAGVAVPAPAATSPFEGSATLTDAQATALTSGMFYFNVHTAANPGGEIRGQVMPAK